MDFRNILYVFRAGLGNHFKMKAWGLAVQLAVLRYSGWSYTHLKSIPHSVIQYIAQQINVPAAAIHFYGQRENTLWSHLKEIRKVYGYQEFTSKEYRQLSKHPLPLALENEDSMYLLNACFEYLRLIISSKIRLTIR